MFLQEPHIAFQRYYGELNQEPRSKLRGMNISL